MVMVQQARRHRGRRPQRCRAHQRQPHPQCDRARLHAAADVPACVKGQTVVSCHPKDYAGVDFVFSALDASVAGDVEAAFRDAGIPVFSNAKNYRMVRAARYVCEGGRRWVGVGATPGATMACRFCTACLLRRRVSACVLQVPDVPLVVPPVNGDHLRMVTKQASYASNGGFIVTNANCRCV